MSNSSTSSPTSSPSSSSFLPSPKAKTPRSPAKSPTKATGKRKRTPSELAASNAEKAQKKAMTEWNRTSRQIAAAEAAYLGELKLRAEIGARCRASHAYQLAHPRVKDSMRARIREGILREREERKALLRRRRAARKAAVTFEDEVGMDIDMSSEEEDKEEAEGVRREAEKMDGETVYMQLRRWAANRIREKEAMLTFRAVNRRHIAARASSPARSILSSPPPSSPVRPLTCVPAVSPSPPPSPSIIPPTTITRVMSQSPVTASKNAPASPAPSSSSSSASSVSSFGEEPIYKPVPMAPGVFVDWKPTAAQLVPPRHELARESCVRGTFTPH